MEFVNRNSEIKRLRSALKKDRAAFVVVYGRRRCGKSTLLRHHLAAGDIYFMADQSEAIRQRELLAKAISINLTGFDRIIYPDWETLFENLNLRLKKRISICLDEFPYLVKTSPELPSVIQKMMEEKKKLNYHLIICGSSQQLMHGLILDSAAPLYGRSDEVMMIKPMHAPYLQDILNCDDIETIEEYSVWGGVPRYWELRYERKSLRDAIKYHILDSQGILYDEPVRLFLDDMRDTVQSYTILSLIATGSQRLSEIAGRLAKPASSLSGPLDKLIRLGYIEREIPFGENPKNSKKSLYKISDQFMNFYFRYVVPNRSFIEMEQPDAIIKLIDDSFGQFVSLQWETLCRRATSDLKFGKISFNPASRWWTSSASGQIEIDVVAESTDGKAILVGECKWSDKKLDHQNLIDALLNKVSGIEKFQGKKIIPALFVKHKDNSAHLKYIIGPGDVLNALKK